MAILAASLLFVLPVDWARRRSRSTGTRRRGIDWGTVILFGGGITLGTLLSETGLADGGGRVARRTRIGVSSLLGVTIVVVIVAVIISETTSNTASAAIVVPIAISIAAAADLNPTIPALAAIFGANYGFMLPVSTPPNAIVYSSGLLPITRMIKAGAVFDVIGIVLCVVGVTVMANVVGWSDASIASGHVQARARRRPRGGGGSRHRAARLPRSARSRCRCAATSTRASARVAAGVTVFFAGRGGRAPAPGGRLAERLGALRGHARRGAGHGRLPVRDRRAGAGSLAVVFALLAVAGLANAVNQPAINLFMADQVPARPAGPRVRHQAVRDPRRDPRERPRAAAARDPARLADHLRDLRRAGAGGGGDRRGSGEVSLPRARRARAAAARASASCSSWRWAPRSPAPGANALGTYLVASAVDVGIAEGTAGLLAALGSAREPRGPHVARRARGPAARLRLRHRGRAAGRGVGRLRCSWPSTCPPPFVVGAVIAFALGWGWPGPVQPRRGGEPPRGARRGHRHHPERHLRGRVAGPARLRAAVRTRSATAAPGPSWPGRRCWRRP